MAAKQDAPATGVAKRKRHTGRYIGLAIFVILVLGGTYFYFTFLSGGIASTAISAAQNPSSFKSTVLQKINSNPQLALNYTGSITFGQDPPFTFSFLKYLNDTRVMMSVSDFPNIGNLSATGVSLDNGSTVYLCYDRNASGYKCAMGAGTETQIVDQIAASFNISNISNLGNAAVKSVSPSYYNGQPCWFATGTGVIYGGLGAFGQGNSNVTFSACVSPSLYVPYNATVVITPQAGNTITIALRSIGISLNTTYSEVASLPGSLINSSS